MKQSELILNPDGSVYHLAILPEDISDLIITVGDPNRVAQVSRFFDSIEVKKANREFVIHTGILNNQRITCLSTGMGTDNIDIVLNELDALVNIDLKHRIPKDKHTSLTLVRIGTSGSIHKNITIGDILYSEMAIGMEGLMHWYTTGQITEKEKIWLDSLKQINLPVSPTVHEANASLMAQFSSLFKPGITLTAPGFYAPQNRSLRLRPSIDLFSELSQLNVNGQTVTNIEMETAGIYGLSHSLGHKALSINLILASRITGAFAENPDKLMEDTIQKTLKVLCA